MLSKQKELEKNEEGDRDDFAVHRIQPIHGSESFVMVFPKKIAVKLQVGRGDYVKCSFKNNSMIVEKVNV